MSGVNDEWYEEEAEKLLEEFLQLDTVSPDIKQRVEKVRSKGNTAQALEEILKARR